MSDASIVVMVGFIGSLIVLITPIIKLNTTITKLDTTMNNMGINQTKTDKKIACHDDMLVDHEKRIYRMEGTEVNK